MTETLFETRWLGVYRIGHWDFVRRPNSDACVGILAVTPDDEVVLIEQFRIPVQRSVIEIPAGLIGDEEAFKGETIIETARRELLEETGYHAGKIETLIISPTSAGMTSEFTHLFFATDLEKREAGGGVGAEDIKVHLVPKASLRSWLREKEQAGLALDFKIHAALWCAGL
ncbi:NUDIX hydrolase [Haloferula chungangensis]|uniref:GDP-mannose pyrophosphatase n=1 Tax=Haloferula chungangensis TaxID=1048331 RepID=A0ABW2L7M6_9BACT